MDDPFPVGDARIVNLLMEGDNNGVSLLLTHYGRRIIFIASKKHGLSTEDAEELMSDVIMEVAKKIESFDSLKGSFSSWIGRIAHRRAIDLFKKNGKKGIEQTMSEDWWSMIGQLDESSAIAFAQPLNDPLKVRIASTMAFLNDREKEILRLRAEGYSLDEIALMLKMEKNAVSVAHYRAKQHFKELWEKSERKVAHGTLGDELGRE